MTRLSNGETVRLSVGNWVAIGVFLAGQTVALGGVGVSMLSRIAVLEAKQEAIGELKNDIRSLRQEVRDLDKRRDRIATEHGGP